MTTLPSEVEASVIRIMKTVSKGEPKGGMDGEVFAIMQRLLQKQRLTPDDIWVLKKWGERGRPPPQREFGQARVWRYCLKLIEDRMRD